MYRCESFLAKLTKAEPQTLNQDDHVIQEAPSAKTDINIPAFLVTPVVVVVASASAAPPAPAGGPAAAAARQDSHVAERVHEGEAGSAASASALGRATKGGGFEGRKQGSTEAWSPRALWDCQMLALSSPLLLSKM